MGRLVITDLFAADAFNKFAGKLVGRMSRNVQLSVSFEEMMNQSPHGFRRITVFAVSGVDEITQIAVYLFAVLLYGEHVNRNVADELVVRQTHGHAVGRAGILPALPFRLD